MSTHSIYVSLETAKMLKSAGFDWHTNLVYVDDKLLTNPYTADWNGTMPDTYTSAPTLDVAQKWLREVKGMHLYVRPILDEHKYVVTVVVDDLTWGQVNDNNGIAKRFNTYEEAQEAGIKKCLTILLEEKNGEM